MGSKIQLAEALPKAPYSNRFPKRAVTTLIYPVFIPMQGCPHKCIYCEQKSFEATAEVDFDVLRKQITAFVSKHQGIRKQIAFYGGTFTGMSVVQQSHYYDLAAPFLDSNTSLRISTRPDYVNPDVLIWCRQHRVTTIELGIQDFSDEVLSATGRGYDSQIAQNACHAVKAAGIELGIQLMPGLPKSSVTTLDYNRQCLVEIKPDLLRLYPLIIISETPLMELYKQGLMQPIALDMAIEICADYIELAEKHGIRVIKCGIPSLKNSTEGVGPYHPAFGELVKAEGLIRKIAADYKAGQKLHLSSGDASLWKGHQQISLKKLQKRLDLCTIVFCDESDLPAGEFRCSSI